MIMFCVSVSGAGGYWCLGIDSESDGWVGSVFFDRVSVSHGAIVLKRGSENVFICSGAAAELREALVGAGFDVGELS